MPKTGMVCPVRNTNRSYGRGPGGAAISGDVRVNVGSGSAVEPPIESSRVVSFAHAGTAIGPTTPVVAVRLAGGALGARTRPHRFSGLSGRRRAYCAVVGVRW